MAVLNPNQVAPIGEVERKDTIAGAIISNGQQAIPGFKAVRGITPLVMTALQRANNPYVTAKQGFEAMGIQFDGEKTNLDDAAFGIAMLPKTAEVMILFTCDREALKHFAVDPAALQDAALDMMENSTLEVLAEATVYVSNQLTAISKTRANLGGEDKPKPKASTLGEGGKSGPKKQAHTNLRKS